MVISSTSATEVSIQAVSPELGVHFSSTASLGSALPAQAGGAASAAAGGGAAAASSAYEMSITDMLMNRVKRTPSASATSPARIGFLNVMGLTPVARRLSAGLARCGVGLAGADTHGAVDAEDEDLSIPDLTGLGCRGDGVDGLVDLVGRDRDLDLDLRQETHRILGAAINFRVALLPPVPLDLGHGHPVHPDRSESVADLVELERLDDGHDDFHGIQPPLRPHPCGCRVQAHFVARCRAKSPVARQGACPESSRVPVRRFARKCMETSTVFRDAGGLLRQFVRRRSKTGQLCIIFNQG